jgi:hypothetical protein
MSQIPVTYSIKFRSPRIYPGEWRMSDKLEPFQRFLYIVDAETDESVNRNKTLCVNPTMNRGAMLKKNQCTTTS